MEMVGYALLSLHLSHMSILLSFWRRLSRVVIRVVVSNYPMTNVCLCLYLSVSVSVSVSVVVCLCAGDLNGSAAANKKLLDSKKSAAKKKAAARRRR